MLIQSLELKLENEKNVKQHQIISKIIHQVQVSKIFKYFYLHKQSLNALNLLNTLIWYFVFLNKKCKYLGITSNNINITTSVYVI